METYLHSWITATSGTSVSANTPQENSITWRAVNILLSSDSIMSMVFHPDDPKIIFVASFARGFTLLTRVQNRWESIPVGLDASPIFSIALKPGDPETIYVAGEGAIFKTVNSGRDWTDLLKSGEGS